MALFRIEDDKARLYKAVFSTPQGQEVLKHLYDNLHLYGIAHDPENHARAAYNDGMRSAALWLYEHVNYQPTEQNHDRGKRKSGKRASSGLESLAE